MASPDTSLNLRKLNL